MLYTFCVCYVLVHCSGVLPNQKDIGTELFAGMDDYINAPIGDGAAMIFTVPPSNTDISSMAYMCFGVVLWFGVLSCMYSSATVLDKRFRSPC